MATPNDLKSILLPTHCKDERITDLVTLKAVVLNAEAVQVIDEALYIEMSTERRYHLHGDGPSLVLGVVDNLSQEPTRTRCWICPKKVVYE